MIGGKSSFEIKSLENICDLGVKNLEFHTFSRDFEVDAVDYNKIKLFLQDHNLNCYCIHAPMDNRLYGNHSMELGVIDEKTNDVYIEYLKKTISLADFLCGDRAIVVSHIGFSYDLGSDLHKLLSTEVFERILFEIKTKLHLLQEYIANYHPRVTLVVENMPAFITGGDVITSWGFGKDLNFPKFIEELNLDNVKTCLDICHAQNVIRSSKVMYGMIDSELNLKDYLNANKNILGLIHFNNIIGFGDVVEKHSTPYRDNLVDKKCIKEVLSFLDEYNIDVPLTLEINETDYFNRKNLSETYDTVVKVARELKIKRFYS